MKLIFDKGNRNWSDSPGMNEFFVSCEVRYFLDLAKARLNEVGYISVMELYSALGIDAPKSALLLGWEKGDDAQIEMQSFGDHIEIETEPKNLFLNT